MRAAAPLTGSAAARVLGFAPRVKFNLPWDPQGMDWQAEVVDEQRVLVGRPGFALWEYRVDPDFKVLRDGPFTAKHWSGVAWVATAALRRL